MKYLKSHQLQNRKDQIKPLRSLRLCESNFFQQAGCAVDGRIRVLLKVISEVDLDEIVEAEAVKRAVLFRA
jgi:hypothetical protein